jgi:hypothetical protein
MNGWVADCIGSSTFKIHGYSGSERKLWITHGYGQKLPVTTCEPVASNNTVLSAEWVETLNRPPTAYIISTAKLSAGPEGIPSILLSKYISRHIEEPGCFERFVDNYFGGTPFLPDMLKTSYEYWVTTNSADVKEALKLILAYCLTLSITTAEGVPEEEGLDGKIEDERSRFNGKTAAPVMISFQIKYAMANQWRYLHNRVLRSLSALYTSMFHKDSIQKLPKIFVMTTVLLGLWELMQFDCYYRTPDAAAANRFCAEMERTAVRVIIDSSQTLPAFLAWNNTQNHQMLGFNAEMCDKLIQIGGRVKTSGKQAAAYDFSAKNLTRICRTISAKSVKCRIRSR